MQWSEILELWAPLRNNSWERVQRKCPVWHHQRPPGLTCHVHEAAIWAIQQSLADWASCFGVITKTTPSQYDITIFHPIRRPHRRSPQLTRMPFKNQNDEMMSGYIGQDQINISQLCWTSSEKGHYVTLIAPTGTIYKATGPLIFIYGQLSRQWAARTISALICSCL